VLVLGSHVHNEEAVVAQYVLYTKHGTLEVSVDGQAVAKPPVSKARTSSHVFTAAPSEGCFVPMSAGSSAQSAAVAHSPEHVSPDGVIPNVARSQTPALVPGTGMHTRPLAQSPVDVHT
jgi:hypothetical protein